MPGQEQPDSSRANDDDGVLSNAGKFRKSISRRKVVKRFILVLAAFSFLLPSIASAKDRTFRGEIWDSSCAKMGSHEAMMKSHPGIKSDKECTLGCVKTGAKFVLYNPATKKVYELDDQQKPSDFAGEKVLVTGTYDKSTDTIHVVSIRKS